MNSINISGINEDSSLHEMEHQPDLSLAQTELDLALEKDSQASSQSEDAVRERLQRELSDLDSDFQSVEAHESSSEETSHKAEPALEREAPKSRSSIRRIYDYQKELILNSMDSNSIVYLPTGKGKTLVALAHIIFHLMRHGTANKKVIFLAGTIQLVKQQHEFICKNYEEVYRLMDQEGILDELYERHLAGEKTYTASWEEVRHHIDFFHSSTSSKEVGETTRQMLKREMFEDWKRLKERFEKTTVAVCISQMFLNATRRGVISVKDIALVVFDQCHHTRKQHPYNCFMEEIYSLCQAEGTPVPKVLGLTASPVDDIQNNYEMVAKVRLSLLELSYNLKSSYVPWQKVQSPESAQQKLKPETVAPKREQYKLKPETVAPKREQKYVGKSIYFSEKNLIRRFQQLQGMNASLRRDSVQLLEGEFPELYQLIRSVYAVFEESEERLRRRQKFNDFRRELLDELELRMPLVWLQLGRCAFGRYFQRVANKVAGLEFVQSNECAEQVKVIARLMGNYCGKFREFDIRKPENHSSKVRMLVRLIKEQGKALHMLIFANERFIVRELALLLNLLYEAGEFARDLESDQVFRVHAQAIVGQSAEEKVIRAQDPIYRSQNPTEISAFIEAAKKRLQSRKEQVRSSELTTEEQERMLRQIFLQNEKRKLFFSDGKLRRQLAFTIQAFKKKQINVLISTSVTEEGFDISSCSCVVAFDPVDKLHSFIQMKGRARKEGSRFFLLTLDEEENREKEVLVEAFQKGVQVIEQQIAKMARSKMSQELVRRELLQLAEQHRKQELLGRLQQKEAVVPLRIKSTGAIVNLNNAGSLLEGYCQSYNQNRRDFKPKKEFVEVKGFGYRCFIIMPSFAPFASVEGYLRRSKVEAERIACFETVRELLKQKKLNAYLQPASEELTRVLHDKLAIELSNDPQIREELQRLSKKQVDPQSKKVKYLYLQQRAQPFYIKLKDPQVRVFSFWAFEFADVNKRLQLLEAKGGVLPEQRVGLVVPLPFSQAEELLEGFKFQLNSKKDRLSRGRKCQYVRLTKICERAISKEDESALQKMHRFLSLTAQRRDVQFYASQTNEMPKRRGQTCRVFEIRKDSYIMLSLVDSTGYDAKSLQLVVNYVKNLEDYYRVWNNVSEPGRLKNLSKMRSEMPVGELADSIRALEAKGESALNGLVLQSIAPKNNLSKYVMSGIIRESEVKSGARPQFQIYSCSVSEEDRNSLLKVKRLKHWYKQTKESFLEPESESVQTAQANQKEPVPLTQFIRYPVRIGALFQACVIVEFVMPKVVDLLIARDYRNKLQRLMEQPCSHESSLATRPNYLLLEQSRFLDALEAKCRQTEPCFYSDLTQSDFKALQAQLYSETRPPVSQEKDWLPIEIKPRANLLTVQEAHQTIYSPTHGNSTVKQNYEVLQFVGDSILKLLVTMELIVRFPDLSESELHQERINLISNKFLMKRAIKGQVSLYVLCKVSRWAVPGFHEQVSEEDDNQNYRAIPPKTLSDVIESTIGSIYAATHDYRLCAGYLARIEVLRSTSLLVSPQTFDYPPGPLLARMEQFCELIGYRFKNPGLLLQAFTNSNIGAVFQAQTVMLKDSNVYMRSEFCTKQLANYERLQFLGDALLDVLVVEQLFERFRFEKSQGDYSQMKQNVVWNKSLALMALRLQLHRFMLFCHSGNETFAKSIDNLYSKLDYYYHNSDEIEQTYHGVLKLLADAFEAFVGAILIDVGLDIHKARAVLMPWLAAPLLHFTTEVQLQKSVVNKLIKLLQSRGCQPPFRLHQDRSEDGLTKAYVLYDTRRVVTSVEAECEEEAWRKLSSRPIDSLVS